MRIEVQYSTVTRSNGLTMNELGLRWMFFFYATQGFYLQGKGFWLEFELDFKVAMSFALRSLPCF